MYSNTHIHTFFIYWWNQSRQKKICYEIPSPRFSTCQKWCPHNSDCPPVGMVLVFSSPLESIWHCLFKNTALVIRVSLCCFNFLPFSNSHDIQTSHYFSYRLRKRLFPWLFSPSPLWLLAMSLIYTHFLIDLFSSHFLFRPSK